MPAFGYRRKKNTHNARYKAPKFSVLFSITYSWEKGSRFGNQDKLQEPNWRWHRPVPRRNDAAYTAREYSPGEAAACLALTYGT